MFTNPEWKTEWKTGQTENGSELNGIKLSRKGDIATI
jgi:hypothetical protein